MKPKTIPIDDDVRDVLKRATLHVGVDGGGTLTLPPKLDRQLYERVNRVLEAMGGRWERRKKAHVFSRDALGAYSTDIDRVSIVDEKATRQAFYTPADLAAKMVALAGIDSSMRVLEPSAGKGAIAKELLARKPAFLALVENDPVAVEALHALSIQYGPMRVDACDFLSTTAPFLGGGFDAIVMNPPFSNSQDVKHVTHAAAMLKPGGVIVAIMSAGVRFRATKAYIDFGAFLGAYFEGTTFEDLPGGTFRESGTEVNTVLLKTYRKR